LLSNVLEFIVKALDNVEEWTGARFGKFIAASHMFQQECSKFSLTAQ